MTIPRKNIEDSSEENTMSDKECQLRAEEKGFGDAGAHRCDERGDVGTEVPESQEWIDKQKATKGGSRPAGASYRTLNDSTTGKENKESNSD